MYEWEKNGRGAVTGDNLQALAERLVNQLPTVVKS
jgi:hypothetical protein